MLFWNVGFIKFFFRRKNQLLTYFVLSVNLKHQEEENRLKIENLQISKLHEDKLQTLKLELHKLQKTHEETLDILREENGAIREEIDEKNSIINSLKECRIENEKLKKLWDIKESSFKEQLNNANEELFRLKEENKRIRMAEGNDNYQVIIEQLFPLSILLQPKIIKF